MERIVGQPDFLLKFLKHKSRFIVVFFCIVLTVCISCHSCIVWLSHSPHSCARCSYFLPVTFVLLDTTAGSSSRPPCALSLILSPFLSTLAYENSFFTSILHVRHVRFYRLLTLLLSLFTSPASHPLYFLIKPSFYLHWLTPCPSQCLSP